MEYLQASLLLLICAAGTVMFGKVVLMCIADFCDDPLMNTAFITILVSIFLLILTSFLQNWTERFIKCLNL
jgi:hypothetical protein